MRFHVASGVGGMARIQRTEAERKDVAAYVRELFARSDADTWDAFARAAGVHPVQVSEWQLGRVVPDGYNLLKLIRAVERAETRTAHPESDEGLAAVVKEVREGFEKLGARMDALEQPPSAVARPARPARKRKTA